MLHASPRARPAGNTSVARVARSGPRGGRTFSPEIEMAALAHGNELLHGEAVTIDMALTTQVRAGCLLWLAYCLVAGKPG